jgi:hypothetical protein
MLSLRGRCVVAWLENGGERFLRDLMPDVYQQLLLQVGGTDVLRRYCGSREYWQHVQAILDCFFTSAERAMMCRELIEEPLFANDPAFRFFLVQAKAEIRSRELISVVEGIVAKRVSLRSIG